MWPLHSKQLKINSLEVFVSLIHTVLTLWGCIYHEFKDTCEKNRLKLVFQNDFTLFPYSSTLGLYIGHSMNERKASTPNQQLPHVKRCFSIRLGSTKQGLWSASETVLTMPCWWAPTRAKHLSMAATARVIWVVRMRTAMAIRGNWYACFSVYFVLAYFCLNTQVSYRWHFHTHAVGELFFNSYHMCSVELALKEVLFLPPWQNKARLVISKWDRCGYAMLVSLQKSEISVHGCHCPGYTGCGHAYGNGHTRELVSVLQYLFCACLLLFKHTGLL